MSACSSSSSGQPEPSVAPEPAPNVDAGPPPPWALPERSRCQRSYAGTPTNEGTIETPALVEVSGLVASPMGQGVLWGNADSGDGPNIYAISPTGQSRGMIILSAETFVDAEDIAAAPCPDGSGPCLWVADAGDNRLERTTSALFAVPEPELPPAAEGATAPILQPERYWRFGFRFPVGPINSEALVVATDASAAWLIEKTTSNRPHLFELTDLSDAAGQLGTGTEQTATDLGAFDAPGVASIQGAQMVTGADLHTSGFSMLLRTYSGVFEVPLLEGKIPDLLTQPAVTITYGPFSEGQGESIAYDAEGYGIWTASEDPDGLSPQPLHHYDCQ